MKTFLLCCNIVLKQPLTSLYFYLFHSPTCGKVQGNSLPFSHAYSISPCWAIAYGSLYGGSCMGCAGPTLIQMVKDCID
ncbi:unnamed protein product [Victoria cruziana]